LRVLIAEDDDLSRRLLEVTLSKAGFEVAVTRDGSAALQILEGADPPKIAVLDWMMPGTDGVEVCRRLRATTLAEPTYCILLTAKDRVEDIVEGLQAGADDYITKPFEREELLARVRVGVRILALQTSLAERVRQLEEALARVKTLQGLLPICSYCKKIRNDQNYWQQVDTYVTQHSAARFSHGICPECYESVVKPQLEEVKKK